MSAQQAFNQPSLFIPSAASQAEYLSTSQLGFPQRSHGFAQSAVPAPPPSAQQNTIIAPPATAALMSTNLKMPGPSHSMDPRQTSAFGTGKTVLSTLWHHLFTLLQSLAVLCLLSLFLLVLSTQVNKFQNLEAADMWFLGVNVIGASRFEVHGANVIGASRFVVPGANVMSTLDSHSN